MNLKEIRERMDAINKAKFDNLDIVFSDDEMTLIEQLAEIDSSYFEGQQGVQNTTSYKSSFIGVLGELAAYKALEQNSDFENVKWLGANERISMANGILIYQEADLTADVVGENRSLKLEVKTIRSGQKEGQVVVKQAKGYKQKGITNVIFVHTIEYANKWKAGMYQIAPIDELLNSSIEKNGNNVDCYTYKT